MGDTLVGLLIGWAVCKFLGLGEDFLSNIFHVSHPSSGPSPAPSPASSTTVVNYSTDKPAGLPPWPSGWKAVDPVTSAHVARAEMLLPTMKMNSVKYETGPGGTWLAYWKHKFDGKIGVTVHQPKVALVAPQPPDMTAPSVGPAPAAQPQVVPVVSPAPSSSHPVLRKGSRGEAVKVWQRAIGVNDDGNFGKGTEAATKAWQSAHGLTPDGVVGRDTWATVPAAA